MPNNRIGNVVGYFSALFDENRLSVPFKGNEFIRANALMPDEPIEYLFENGKTLHEIFLRGVKISGDKSCLGWRKGPDEQYSWITYNEVLNRSQCVGSGLIANGCVPDSSQLIGILSKNRIEWMLVEQACNCYSMVTVPLLDNLSSELIEYIIQQSGLTVIIVETSDTAKILLNSVMNMTYSLKLIIVIEELDSEVEALGRDYQVKIIPFSNLEKEGKSAIQNFVPPKPDDLHTISYTSAINGPPNGVMLTHKNIVSCAASILLVGPLNRYKLESDDVYFSFVSLSRVFEIVIEASIFAIGARVGYYCGNMDHVLKDMRAVQPTLVQVMQKNLVIFQGYVMGLFQKSCLKTFLYKTAYKSKLKKLLQKGQLTKTTIWDFMLFQHFQKLIGGRVRVCFCSGIPVAAERANFVRCLFGLAFIQAYGMNETSSAISLSRNIDLYAGSVGPPLPCNLVKLVDLTDKKSLVSDKGEVCVKGANLFSGYFNDEEKTREYLDEDDWLHTGDIAIWLPNGSLKLVDRKPCMIKLQDGEEVNPENIESIFMRIPVILQMFVYGDKFHNHLVGLIVPDPEKFRHWCNRRKIFGNYAHLCESAAIHDMLLSDMIAHARLHGVKPSKVPRKIWIAEENFTVENGLLSSDKTVHRFEIYVRYRSELESLLDED